MPTTDLFLGGRLRLAQAARGHRAGTDAVLLQACVRADARGAGVDVGAGVGAAGLSALVRAPGLSMTLAEIDPAGVARARANIEANGFAARARAVEVDILRAAARRAAGLADGAATLVLTNPPFYSPAAARASPDADRARAHMGEIGPWMKAALALLAPGGRFAMIHRPEALKEILDVAEGRLGALRLKPVLARAGAPAVRLLVAGVKASRAPLAISPQLVLHDDSGAFTPEAEAIHKGEAEIDMR